MAQLFLVQVNDLTFC